MEAGSSTDPRSPPGSSSQPSSQPGSASRSRTPGSSYSDRFIPSRRGTNLQDSFALLPDSQPRKRDAPQEGAKDDNLDTYTMLLRSELLSEVTHTGRRGTGGLDDLTTDRAQKNLFRYRTVPTARDENAAFALSPVGSDSQRVLCSPRKVPRKISTVPYKVLDAPALQVSRSRSRCPSRAGALAVPTTARRRSPTPPLPR